MSLKRRLARQEKAAGEVLRRHPLARIIPLNERAPMTLAQWRRLAELHGKAMKLFRERLRAGARLLTCHPDKEEEEEALLLSGAEVYVSESDAWDLLTGADRQEFERLLMLWWDAHKARFLEGMILQYGQYMSEEEKADLRMRVRA